MKVVKVKPEDMALYGNLQCPPVAVSGEVINPRNLKDLIDKVANHSNASSQLFRLFFSVIESRRIVDEVKRRFPKRGSEIEELILAELKRSFSMYLDSTTLSGYIANLLLDIFSKKSDAVDFRKVECITDSFNISLSVVNELLRKIIKEERQHDLHQLPQLPQVLVHLLPPSNVLLSRNALALHYLLRKAFRLVVQSREDVFLSKVGDGIFKAYEWDSEKKTYLSEARIYTSSSGELIRQMGVYAPDESFYNYAYVLGSYMKRLVFKKTKYSNEFVGDNIDFIRFLSFRSTGSGEYRDYYIASETIEKSVHFGMLVDVSGSMTDVLGRKSLISIAMDSLWTVGEALLLAGLKFVAAAYSQSSAGGVRIAFLKDDAKSTAFNLPNLEADGGTPTGPALRFFSRYMHLKLPKGRKVLFLITDGRPNTVFSGSSAEKDVAKAIEEASKLNITVISIIIGDFGENVKKQFIENFGLCIFIKNAYDLLGSISGIVSVILKSIRGEVK